jgi:hypothetical protein
MIFVFLMPFDGSLTLEEEREIEVHFNADNSLSCPNRVEAPCKDENAPFPSCPRRRASRIFQGSLDSRLRGNDSLGPHGHAR